MNIRIMHILMGPILRAARLRLRRSLAAGWLRRPVLSTLVLTVLLSGATPPAQGATITVDANGVLGTVPAGQAWQTGSVLEDINHSVYGGVYSQLIFGERFMEPPPFPRPVGTWDLYNNGSNAENGVQWLSADPPKDVRFMWSYINPTTIQSEGGLANIMMNRDVSITSGRIGFSICFPDYHEGGEGGLMFSGNATDPYSGMWLHLWDGGSFNVIGGTVANNTGGTCPELAVGAVVQVVLTFDGATISVSLNGRTALTTTYSPPTGSGGASGSAPPDAGSNSAISGSSRLVEPCRPSAWPPAAVPTRWRLGSMLGCRACGRDSRPAQPRRPIPSPPTSPIASGEPIRSGPMAVY